MRDFLEWWNAIYWVPLALSLLWILLTALMGHHGQDHTHGPVHAHGHVGHGAHGHFNGHAQAGHGHTAGGGATHAHATSGAHGHAAPHSHGAHAAPQHHETPHPHWAARLMDVLGLGRVPLTLVMGFFMLFWGTIGLIANNVLRDAGMPPAAFVVPSLAGTFLFTAIATRLTIGVVGRLIPPTETFAITAYDLIGRQGQAVYPITETAGTVQVTDVYGTLHRRMARGEPGSPRIPANRPILVVGVDDDADRNQLNDRLIVREYSEPSEVA